MTESLEVIQHPKTFILIYYK